MESQKIPCPFVYANGRHCSGVVYKARAHGPTRADNYVDRADLRKYRLWCSDKDDHTGAVSDSVTKDRMEFYPNDLPTNVGDLLWSGTDLE
jgi:hypothetical protein